MNTKRCDECCRLVYLHKQSGGREPAPTVRTATRTHTSGGITRHLCDTHYQAR